MNRVINFVRAVLHTALLAVTVMPWALAAVVLRLFGNEKSFTPFASIGCDFPSKAER